MITKSPDHLITWSHITRSPILYHRGQ